MLRLLCDAVVDSLGFCRWMRSCSGFLCCGVFFTQFLPCQLLHVLVVCALGVWSANHPLSQSSIFLVELYGN